MFRIAAMLIGLVYLMGLSIAWAQEPPEQPGKSQEKKTPAKDGKKVKADRQGKLKPGDSAPPFSLQDMHGEQTVALAQLQGKPVVLYFGSCS
jgi:cytochrome oxidase Cu insertion factor (SCO1/SenC/PrrC family)